MVRQPVLSGSGPLDVKVTLNTLLFMDDWMVLQKSEDALQESIEHLNHINGSCHFKTSKQDDGYCL